MYAKWIKPLLDRVAAAILIIIFSPFLVITAIAIWKSMGSPVFFIQPRPGYLGKVFNIIKFRTMDGRTDDNGNLLPDKDRLHGVGKIVRSWSLDELPQLFNVLKGDMSFVGPRPLLEEYLPLYSDRQKKRHNVKPGITGWAQVHGRNTISWEEKFEYDVWYVEHQSFLLDMKILWMTLVKVLKREGISQEGHQTMEKFTGNE